MLRVRTWHLLSSICHHHFLKDVFVFFAMIRLSDMAPQIRLQGSVYLSGYQWEKNDQSIMVTCDSSSCHVQSWVSNDCSGTPDYSAGLSNSCGVCYPINVLLTFKLNNVSIHTHALATPQNTWKSNLLGYPTRSLSIAPATSRRNRFDAGDHEFLAGERDALECSTLQIQEWKVNNADNHKNSSWWFPRT